MEWHTKTVEEFLEHDNRSFDLVIADPVYSNQAQLLLVSELRRSHARICFCYPEDIRLFGSEPDQLCHWVKPVSTKNTSKKYSRFVEAIAVWHGPYFCQDIHWSCRTGVFTDHLVETSGHPWKKPFSLIEKLVRLHCPLGGSVLDLFSGSGTTEDVCKTLGIDCVSVEFDPKWSRGS